MNPKVETQSDRDASRKNDGAGHNHAGEKDGARCAGTNDDDHSGNVSYQLPPISIAEQEPTRSAQETTPITLKTSSARSFRVEALGKSKFLQFSSDRDHRIRGLVNGTLVHVVDLFDFIEFHS